MIGKTRAQLRREHVADLAGLAERVGCTVEQADDLLGALPYSAIPDVGDMHRVLDMFEELGWRHADAEG